MTKNIIQSRFLWAFLFLACFVACGSSDIKTYDIIIRGTQIVDGTGKPMFRGDVGINGDRIAAVGRVRGRAATEIDGSSFITCPGFIDAHSHADQTILEYPLAENFVMQGITTVLAGNCGSSPGPTQQISLGDWMNKVKKGGISINLAMLAGHGTIRTAVMGGDFKRNATLEEIDQMKVHIEQAMKDGAFGLSTSLDPSPGEYASTEEVVELLKVVERFGGLYSPHTRHHQNQWWTDDPQEYGYGLYHGPKGEVITGRYHGLLEAIEISEEANNIPLLIAHFTPAYNIPQPHPTWLQQAVARASLEEIVDRPRNEGHKISFTVIANPSSIAGMEAIVSSFFNPRLVRPEWLQKLSSEAFAANLRDASFREKVKSFFYSGRFKLGMLHPLTDPYWMDCYRILSCRIKEYEGRTLGEIAREKSPKNIVHAVYDSSVETLLDIIMEDRQATWGLILDKREWPGALSVFVKHPAGMPCLDSPSLPAIFDETDTKVDGGRFWPSPNYYGLFAYYIDSFVNKQEVLSIEEAVNRMSYVPAQKVLGLEGRGQLLEGAFADIVILDLDKIKMTGDFFHPNRPPDGIEYVLVNGQIVYSSKKHNGLKPGKVLLHTPSEAARDPS